RGTARDETAIVEARRRAEAAEALLRDAVDSISEGFVIFDAKDRLVVCNEAYRRLYPQNAPLIVPGAQFEDFLRAGIANGEHPEAAGREEEWIAERIRVLHQDECTFELQLSNGQWILVSERRTAHGGRAGLRIDITALKTIQAELRASREALAAEAERSREIAADLANAQRVAQIGSVARDFHTGKVEWSEETFRILGLDPAGPPDYDRFLAMIHPEDRHLFDPTKAIGSAPALPSFEYRVIRPDGAIRFIHREAEAVFDENRNPLKRITTMMDVTELRQAERELRASQETLAWAERTLGLGIISVNLATGEAKASPIFRSIHGLSEAICPGPEMLAEVGRHVHPDGRAAWTAHIAAMHSKGACEPFEFHYIRPDDGREVWLREESDIVLDENGRPASQITTVRDVSARHARDTRAQELEKQLLHSQKLESLGTLAGGIAHDLNNTLAPILALSQF
ncbi:MAG: PAS-domain containing protein, partial [Stellaceae bacterium]